MLCCRLALCLALLAGVAACSKAPGDDVRVQLDGAYLVIENRTGADIHQRVQPTSDNQAWVPTSLPDNRLESGRRMRVRIAPSERGEQLQVLWWRPGRKLADGNRGADLVRRKRVLLDELAEPLPADEQLVRVCTALMAVRAVEQRSFTTPAFREAARNYSPAAAERECMAAADDCLVGRDCDETLGTQQLLLDATRKRLKGQG